MPLTTAFFGTPEAAVPTLEHLLASPHRVLAAVTAPDRPAGRGLRLASSPVKQAALAAGVPVLQPATLSHPGVQAELAGLGADVFVVCAYGFILPPALLEAPRLGAVNVHFSLLPAYRGAAPVARAVLDGRAETGVTIMQMDEGLDTGAILAQAAEPIGPEDDTGTLERRLAERGAALAVELLDALEAGTVAPHAQDAAAASYAAKLSPDEARIDWSEEAPAIARRVRAFRPRPGAWTMLGGRRLKVWQASALAADPGAEPGTLVEVPGEGPDGGAGGGPGRPAAGMAVAAGSGVVLLDEVQPEGGRRMGGAELLRGLRERPRRLG
jgi:methionyl-tRNA formyltransferase